MAARSAIAWPNGKAYLFFDNNTYNRYDLATGVREDAGISVPPQWPGFLASPKPFFWWGFGKAYGFSGPNYFRYEAGTNGVEGVELRYLPPNPPVTIAGNWRGLPAPWAAGIDAAVNWGTGKIFLFRGAEYVRYDMAADRADDGYPRSIANNWPGVFAEGINAVLYPGGRFAYFFRDDVYRRYDVDADSVDLEARIDSFVLTPTPAGGIAPVRSLTPARAASLVTDLIARGKLSVAGSATPAPGQRLVLKPATVNGVRLTNLRNPLADVTDNVDQRMAVVLSRLAGWLNASEPTVTELFHFGIGHGGPNPNDCHNQGRALDFGGVSGTLQNAPFRKMVLADWGNLPSVPGRAVRIDPSVDVVAHALFLTTYIFGCYECESNGIGANNRYPHPNLGGSGFVIYPDYGGDAALRGAHRDHIHMQIGPTR